MPSNPHKCDSSIKEILFKDFPSISHCKCCRNQSKVVSGAELNQAFEVNKFIYTKKYQFCQYSHLNIKQHYKDAYNIILNSKGSPEPYKEKINVNQSSLSQKTSDSYCSSKNRKRYQDLSSTQRHEREKYLSAIILDAVCLGKNSDTYIIENREKVAVDIDYLLDRCKVKLGKLLKVNILSNRQATVPPPVVKEEDPEFDWIVNAVVKIEQEVEQED